MSVVRSHYDNLQVSRTASTLVITGAYRALCLRYHPDLNVADPRAQKIMKMINKAYEVLRDPQKRATHDEWIRQKENKAAAGRRHSYTKIAHALRPKVLFAALLICLILAAFVWRTDPLQSEKLPQYIREYPVVPLERTIIRRPESDKFDQGSSARAAPTALPLRAPQSGFSLDPTGNPWPVKASYVAGFPILRADGLSRVTIDNSVNRTGKFLKLVALDRDLASPIREVFIPGGESFTMRKVRAGRYDLRYEDSADHELLRSESFLVEEVSDESGTKFSVLKITLFSLPGGTFQTFPLNRADF